MGTLQVLLSSDGQPHLSSPKNLFRTVPTKLKDFHCCHRELEYVLENAQVQSLLTTGQYASKLEAPAKHMNINMHILDSDLPNPPANESSTAQLFNDLSASSGSQSEAEQALHGHMQQINHSLDDGALLVYTSGTTGKPKGYHYYSL